MNKLIIDKATDKEKRIIREKMSCLLDELDEKDKKKYTLAMMISTLSEI